MLVGFIAGCGGSTSQKQAAPPRGQSHAEKHPGASHANAHPVAGTFKPDDTKLEGCTTQSCFEQAFGNIAYYQGPKAAITLFDRDMRNNPAVEAGCHRIAHYIGAAALAHFHGNVTEAFAQGSSSCWSGYYHGILERSLARATTKAQATKIARGVCSGQLLRRTLWLAYQCVHGLGHGLMIWSGYNLPYALSVCDGLATEWDQTSCTGGVFMENVNASGGTAYGTKTRWLKDDDLVYPCNAVAKRHKLYCYLMVTSRVLQANGYDWKATAKICSSVEKGWVATCFQSYGRDADGFTRQNPTKVVELCRIAGAGEGDCLYGAARDMTANYAGGDRAATLCARVDARYKSRCFYGIGTILGGLTATPAEHRAACRRLGSHVRDCLRGTGDL